MGGIFSRNRKPAAPAPAGAPGSSKPDISGNPDGSKILKRTGVIEGNNPNPLPPIKDSDSQSL